MKAHDVRHLQLCAHCKTIGDRRHMVFCGEFIGVMHGRCAINVIGLDGPGGLLSLPHEETARLTLDDIGAAAMRALLNARDTKET